MDGRSHPQSPQNIYGHTPHLEYCLNERHFVLDWIGQLFLKQKDFLDKQEGVRTRN